MTSLGLEKTKQGRAPPFPNWLIAWYMEEERSYASYYCSLIDFSGLSFLPVPLIFPYRNRQGGNRSEVLKSSILKQGKNTQGKRYHQWNSLLLGRVVEFHFHETVFPLYKFGQEQVNKRKASASVRALPECLYEMSSFLTFLWYGRFVSIDSIHVFPLGSKKQTGLHSDWGP